MRSRGIRLACRVALVTGLALPGSLAWGQLDSTCMVSVLNRTTPVGPDGSWVLSNVPSALGKVRVRATCVDQGQVAASPDLSRCPAV